MSENDPCDDDKHEWESVVVHGVAKEPGLIDFEVPAYACKRCGQIELKASREEES